MSLNDSNDSNDLNDLNDILSRYLRRGKTERPSLREIQGILSNPKTREKVNANTVKELMRCPSDDTPLTYIYDDPEFVSKFAPLLLNSDEQGAKLFRLVLVELDIELLNHREMYCERLAEGRGEKHDIGGLIWTMLKMAAHARPSLLEGLLSATCAPLLFHVAAHVYSDREHDPEEKIRDIELFNQISRKMISPSRV